MIKWIVLGEKEGGKIELISKGEVGILPKGSFLTVEENNSKFILRVDDSRQIESYVPSPLVAEMGIPGLYADKKCVNKITAYRVKDTSEREDGLVDFIHPLSEARLSTQEEVDSAMNSNGVGPAVFISSIQSNQNRVIKGDDGKRIRVCLPEDMFWHQMMVCGKTGSGKTVSMKYLAQYFIEKMEGAVLAINVKDVDFLQMDKASNNVNDVVLSEWADLNESARGIGNVMMYMPANRNYEKIKGINKDICQKVTLNVADVQPSALTGMLQGISDKGALLLPNIFNYWRETEKKKGVKLSFNKFADYFRNSEDHFFKTLSERGDEGGITLHAATFDNISRSIDTATDFFDNDGAKSLDYGDILQYGKMSVLDFSGPSGPRFGSILLRDLLKKIVDAKSNLLSDIPILIIIDEVHQFYGDNSAAEALGDLDTICRTGRSMKIGVMFASQNPTDIPKGLSSVINTKLFFKTDSTSMRDFGMKIQPEELEGLKQGYAIVQIHGMPQLKIVKFPLALSGVVINE